MNSKILSAFIIGILLISVGFCGCTNNNANKEDVEPVQNITVKSLNESIKISWPQNSEVNYYKIYKNGEYIANTSKIKFIDSNVEFGTTYTYRISPVSNGEEGKKSEPIYGELKDTQPPSQIENLKIQEKTQSIQINWGKASDNIKIDHYNIYRNGEFYKKVKDKTFLDKNLNTSKNYIYEVSAVDIAGNEGKESKPVAGTPKEPAKFTFSNLNLTPKEVKPGNPVTISTEIRNTGETEGERKVKLYINEKLQKTKSVNLSKNEKTNVEFTVEKEEEDTYTVRIGNLEKEFVVEKQKAGTNAIQVNTDSLEGYSHFVSYSPYTIKFKIDKSESEINKDLNDYKLLVDVQEYPRGNVIEYWTKDISTAETDPVIKMDVNLSNSSLEGRYYYSGSLIPDDKGVDSLESSDFNFLHETDPFKITEEGLEESEHPDALEEIDQDRYSREVVEGMYKLNFSGVTEGTEWSFGYVIYKSAYIEYKNKPRGRSREEYVTFSRTEGTADTFAEILNEKANELGFEGRTKVEFVIDVVQSLPYVSDEISTGFDDYTNFPLETLAKAEADCEDTSILLASLLESDPFNYDMILIRLPKHMAVGIKGGEDVYGIYYELNNEKYYFIETTAMGWGIGDMPESLKDEEATLIQV